MRDFLSLTRSERRALRLLASILIILSAFRLMLPGLMRPEMKGLSLADAEILAFLDSLGIVDLQPAGLMTAGLFTGTEPADRGSALHASRLENNVKNPDANAAFRITQGEALIPGTGSMHPGLNEPFHFDPNLAGQETLRSLGMDGRTAGNLIRYREAGGSFRADSDLLKIYGMSTVLFNRLQPFILIRNDTSSLPSFELNSADSATLVSVYGIGPVFARRILRYRHLLGGFHSSHQLKEIYGLGEDRYRELCRVSHIDSGLVRRIDLNRVDVPGLFTHPYLDRYQSEAVVSYRERMGPYRHTEDLLRNGLVPDSVYRSVLPYLFAGDSSGISR